MWITTFKLFFKQSLLDQYNIIRLNKLIVIWWMNGYMTLNIPAFSSDAPTPNTCQPPFDKKEIMKKYVQTATDPLKTIHTYLKKNENGPICSLTKRYMIFVKNIFLTNKSKLTSYISIFKHSNKTLQPYMFIHVNTKFLIKLRVDVL